MNYEEIFSNLNFNDNKSIDSVIRALEEGIDYIEFATSNVEEFAYEVAYAEDTNYRREALEELDQYLYGGYGRDLSNALQVIRDSFDANAGYDTFPEDYFRQNFMDNSTGIDTIIPEDFNDYEQFADTMHESSEATLNEIRKMITALKSLKSNSEKLYRRRLKIKRLALRNLLRHRLRSQMF